jgi:hypothetical protein
VPDVSLILVMVLVEVVAVPAVKVIVSVPNDPMGVVRMDPVYIFVDSVLITVSIAVTGVMIILLLVVSILVLVRVPILPETVVIVVVVWAIVSAILVAVSTVPSIDVVCDVLLNGAVVENVPD